MSSLPNPKDLARMLAHAEEMASVETGSTTEDQAVSAFVEILEPIINQARTHEHNAAEFQRAERVRQLQARKAQTFATTITIVPEEIERVVDQAEQALIDLGGVYVRGRMLVEVVHDTSAPDWLDRPKGTPVVVPIAPDRVRELLGKAARWMKWSKQREGYTPVAVPTWVVNTLLARQEWRLPALEGVVDAPTLRADGTLLTRPGYDASTRLIYEPGASVFPEIEDEPTLDDAKRAYADLIAPLVDFPFVAASDKAAAVAAILTIVGRAAINGCVPMFSYGAPTPGSGKGLLCDACTLIGTGRLSEKMANTEQDEEWRKRLLAFALAAPATLVIDNASGAFGSDVLAMALTSGVISDRVLGASKQVSATIRFVPMLTGNNIVFVKDMGRRVVLIDIDPKVENPEDRQGFTYPHLVAYIRQHRARLYMAALTLLRAYHVAGRPNHGHAPMGSFEAWDALVRGSIVWVSGDDPLGGVTRIREAADGDRDDLRNLLTAWRGCFGQDAVTVGDAVKHAQRIAAGDQYQALCEALRAFDQQLDTRRLGYMLRRLSGRIADKMAFARGDKTMRGVTWRVVGL